MSNQFAEVRTSVMLDVEQRRALCLLRAHGLMTIPAFAAAMWLTHPNPEAAGEMLNELRRMGLVEAVLRSVGPLRFGLTSAGLDEARS